MSTGTVDDNPAMACLDCPAGCLRLCALVRHDCTVSHVLVRTWGNQIGENSVILAVDNYVYTAAGLLYTDIAGPEVFPLTFGIEGGEMCPPTVMPVSS